MSKPGNGSMRESMPEFAAWIDDLRRVFGREMIDNQIRRGVAGEPTFSVESDGVVVAGTRRAPARSMDVTQWRHYLATGQLPTEDLA